MSDIEFMEVRTTEFTKLVGDIYVPVQISDGVVEYVQAHKNSLFAVLRTCGVQKVEIGLQERSYRDTIIFIKGLET